MFVRTVGALLSQSIGYETAPEQGPARKTAYTERPIAIQIWQDRLHSGLPEHAKLSEPCSAAFF